MEARASLAIVGWAMRWMDEEEEETVWGEEDVEGRLEGGAELREAVACGRLRELPKAEECQWALAAAVDGESAAVAAAAVADADIVLFFVVGVANGTDADDDEEEMKGDDAAADAVGKRMTNGDAEGADPKKVRTPAAPSLTTGD